MAHFAKIENNLVTQVIVVANNDILDDQGNESESIGAQFCADLLGGTWMQTSYNGNFRKNYAGIGFTYDATLDAFIEEKPHPSYVFVQDTCSWTPPLEYPSDGLGYHWDESIVNWVLADIS